MTYWIGGIKMGAGKHLDLGAAHPTRAGAVRIDVDGSATAVASGWLHRGVEKLFEVRDYRAALALANRHDWQSPVAGELSIALAIERGLGIGIPERAIWLRTLAAEHARAQALLGFLSWRRLDTRFLSDAADLREGLREAAAAWTGNRLHLMITRIGGVASDVDATWLEQEASFCARIEAAGDRAEDLLSELPGLDVGHLPVAELGPLGLSGPAARAAGLPWDVRREHPYLAYAELDVRPAEQSASTARARLVTLATELRHTALLMKECVHRLGYTSGDIATRLPQNIRLPEGAHYVPVEAPLGEAGARIVSRGEKVPWRLSLRTPSQPQVYALRRALVDVDPTDAETVEAVIASLPWVVGDLDK